MGIHRRKAVVLLGVVGISAIPLVAFARHLQPAELDASTMAAPISPPNANATPSPPITTTTDIVVDADPWSTSTEVRTLRRPAKKLPRPLDSWSGTERAQHALARQAIIDWADPWGGPQARPGVPADPSPQAKPSVPSPPAPQAKPSVPSPPAPQAKPAPLPPLPSPNAPVTQQQSADEALRQAIKAAVDAGDLERAAKLIEVLRTTKH